MNDRALAALSVLGIWWLSTGIVLRMVWLGRTTLRIAVSGAVGVAGLVALFYSSRTATTGAAYVAFGGALAVWAWHELMFLLGVITGPRKLPAPAGVRGWQRFRFATAAVIHHEVALAVTLGAIILLSWGEPNQVGTWTFEVLWVMRLSAKLNVFLGVRNLSEQFVPDHLRYMLSYFRRARMNALMPFTVVAASGEVVHLAIASLAADATAFVVVSRSLVATLLALAVLEHVFLALPVPDAVLWRWATRVQRQHAKPVPVLTVEAP